MLTRPIGVGLATQAIRKRLLEELDRNATPARAVVGELVA